jgi:hypothetical protein
MSKHVIVLDCRKKRCTVRVIGWVAAPAWDGAGELPVIGEETVPLALGRRFAHAPLALDDPPPL